MTLFACFDSYYLKFKMSTNKSDKIKCFTSINNPNRVLATKIKCKRL